MLLEEGLQPVPRRRRRGLVVVGALPAEEAVARAFVDVQLEVLLLAGERLTDLVVRGGRDVRIVLAEMKLDRAAHLGRLRDGRRRARRELPSGDRAAIERNRRANLG